MNKDKSTALQSMLESLKDIGFAESVNVKRDLDRLLRDPLHRQLLTCFAGKISKQNKLEHGQKAKFMQLDESAKCYEQNALQHKITMATIKEQMLQTTQKQLQQTLASKQHYKDLLLQQLKYLDICERESTEVIDSSEKHLKLTIQKTERSQYSSECQKKKVAASIASLENDFGNFISQYKNDILSGGTMLRVDLDRYLISENSFALQLTKFVREKFKETAISINDSLTETFDIMSIRDKSLLAGELATVQEQVSKEIDLAINGYISHKQMLVDAKTSLASTNAKLKMLENRLQFYSQDTIIPPSEQHLQALVLKTNSVQPQLNFLRDDAVPKLIAKGLPLHKTQFMTKDCHKKVIEQKEFSSKQQMVISFLLSQCARLSLIWLILHCESTQVKVATGWVGTMLLQLSKLLQDTIKQTSALHLHSQKEKKEPKAIIDTRDEVLLDICKMLVGELPYGTIFHTVASVSDAAMQLRQKKDQHQKKSQEDFRSSYPHLNSMEDAKSKCQDVVTTKEGKVCLTPDPVQTPLLKLLDSVEQIKSKLPGIFENVKEKRDAQQRESPNRTNSLWIELVNGPGPSTSKQVS